MYFRGQEFTIIKYILGKCNIFWNRNIYITRCLYQSKTVFILARATWTLNEYLLCI